MKTLYIVVLLVALPCVGLLGYKLGSWSLADARAQLENIDRASKKAELANEELRQRLDLELKTLQAGHERETQQLRQAFNADKAALSRSLESTAQRLGALSAERQRVATELELTLKARELAAGAQKEALKKKEQELQALQAQLESERAGLACLSSVVPREAVHILNHGQAQAQRARR